jgi:hypothetical protein
MKCVLFALLTLARRATRECLRADGCYEPATPGRGAVPPALP